MKLWDFPRSRGPAQSLGDLVHPLPKGDAVASIISKAKPAARRFRSSPSTSIRRSSTSQGVPERDRDQNLAFYADTKADVFETLKQDGKVLGLPTSILVSKDGCALGGMAGPARWDSQDAVAFINAAKGMIRPSITRAAGSPKASSLGGLSPRLGRRSRVQSPLPARSDCRRRSGPRRDRPSCR